MTEMGASSKSHSDGAQSNGPKNGGEVVGLANFVSPALACRLSLDAFTEEASAPRETYIGVETDPPAWGTGVSECCLKIGSKVRLWRQM